MSNGDDVTSAIRPINVKFDGMERKREQPSGDEGDDGKGAKRGRVQGKSDEVEAETATADDRHGDDASAEARTPKLTTSPGEPIAE